MNGEILLKPHRGNAWLLLELVSTTGIMQI
jgi:hypothetical protein